MSVTTFIRNAALVALLTSAALAGRAAAQVENQLSGAIAAFAEETQRQQGHHAFSGAIRGAGWVGEGFRLGPGLVTGNKVELLAEGGGLLCAGGSVLALGPLFGGAAGAFIYEPCADLVRLGSRLQARPDRPAPPIEAALRQADREYPAAPDLLNASRKEILDYQIDLHEDVVATQTGQDSDRIREELEQLWELRREAGGSELGDVAVTTQGSGAASDAAQRLARDTIAYQCMGSGGSISPDTVKIRDLDADGAPDILIDHAGIDCSSGKLPLSCGVRACEVHAYLQRGERFDEAFVQQAMFLGIGEGSPPDIRLMTHSMDEYVLGWDGGQFSQR